MRIVVAEYAGACYGVNRALELVRKAKRTSFADTHVHTLGPLIHNPVVVDELEKEGIDVAESLERIPAGDIVVIRSHGVPPETIHEAESLGIHVVDATCPYVSKAQRAAAELNADHRFVIVVGEAGHPEVEGICACAPGNVCVVSSPDDIADTLPERVGIVVQTTQSRELLEQVVAEVRKRSNDVLVRDTVCLATRQRQESAAELAGKVDLMIIIGGRNSGNTRRLVDICKAECPRSYHIEMPSELEAGWFEGVDLVGVTAGASTPASQIDEVVEALELLA